MRDLKNKLTSGKNTKNIQTRKGKSFGYQVLGFGAGGTSAPEFIVATGGTITESGNFRIHTFTGNGTFTVCSISESACAAARNNVSYLVVAGGASGGESPVSGGGGGAGGFREYRAPLSGCYAVSPLNGNPGGTSITVTAQAYPIAVGGGGPGGSGPCNTGNSGGVSTFACVTSAGGGGGAAYGCQPANAAGPGGSGGGGQGAAPTVPGGTGNTPPTTPPQGNNGGPAGGNPSNYANAGGGGGATAVGTPVTGNYPGGGPGGDGGAGATTSISASPTAYAGGGGGSADNRIASRAGGTGGTGGGGNGGGPNNPGTTAGADNTGGGGGGEKSTGPNQGPAGSGGSGIVIIRYQYQQENNMAHFAKISETNEVLTVNVVDNKDVLNADGVEDETVGQQYLEQHNNWPAHLWIQTSYNTQGNVHKNGGTPFRGNYAGIGNTWDEDNQIFWRKKPYPSWVKHIASASWKSPIGDVPALTAEQISQNEAETNMWYYVWNEDNQSWDLTDRNA